MAKPSISRILDLTATLAVTAASLMLMWHLAFREPARSPARPSGYEVGERLDWSPTARSEAGALVIFVRTTCRYCTASMEFYRRLATEPRSVVLVGMGWEPREVLEEYFREHRVELDEVVSIDPVAFKFRSTPTLLRLDRDSRILDAWVGQLPSATEQDVANTLR